MAGVARFYTWIADGLESAWRVAPPTGVLHLTDCTDMNDQQFEAHVRALINKDE